MLVCGRNMLGEAQATFVLSAVLSEHKENTATEASATSTWKPGISAKYFSPDCLLRFRLSDCWCFL